LRFSLLILFACVLVLIPAVPAKADTQNAAELIEQAHQYDNMYTLGPDASQQEAIRHYEAALAAGPDDKQRLHILYRMAQLNGSAYERQKGEEPDYKKAISLYKQIIDDYPPDEPLVQSAMISLAGHYTTLGRYETSLEWSRKILEYDTNKLAEQIKAAEDQRKARDDYIREHGDDPLTEEERREFKKQLREAHSLKGDLAAIRQYQEAAVDQIAYTAWFIEPLVAYSELSNITRKYSGTFIANRAAQCLQENMDRFLGAWEPPLDENPGPGGSLLAGSSAPAAAGQTQYAIQAKPDILFQTAQESNFPEPNIKKSLNEHANPENPRAPPQVQPLKYILIGTAGLIALAFAVNIIRKKTFS